ncbi:MAG: host attachment protein [endosymbiont of Galathealinum brachiosum]|uniref:Host attachment protein n=1 Tax=endosymbiont of Galathealinum brachiosum TaxID=2200906 RepID=A0A370D6M5_9GAMM|nr:MAG: host attachment protein [endosymbiont of Galathealinum brachiosum]
MKTTMVVVADSTRARIFTWDSEDHTVLIEIEDMTHPEGRLHERDMTSDLPGRESGANGAGGHAYDNKDNPKKHQQVDFAKRISTHLDDERKANKLSRLLLIVAPEFLGELRGQFSNELSKLIAFELPKNLAAHGVADIEKHIPKSSEYRKIL